MNVFKFKKRNNNFWRSKQGDFVKYTDYRYIYELYSKYFRECNQLSAENDNFKKLKLREREMTIFNVVLMFVCAVMFISILVVEKINNDLNDELINTRIELNIVKQLVDLK